MPDVLYKVNDVRLDNLVMELSVIFVLLRKHNDKRFPSADNPWSVMFTLDPISRNVRLVTAHSVSRLLIERFNDLRFFSRDSVKFVSLHCNKGGISKINWSTCI